MDAYDQDNFVVFFLTFTYLFFQNYLESRRRSAANHYTDSASLQRPNQSAMHKVLTRRNNGAYIVHFGLTPDAFDDLHSLFRQHDPEQSAVGRPRSLSTRMVLALVLAWLRGCMKQETMVLLFEATAATISRAKRYGLGVLYRIFTANPNDVRWKISWPSPEEMNRFANMVEANTTNLFVRPKQLMVFLALWMA